MVISYLEKLQDTHTQEKYEIEKRLSELEIHLKENIEFIKLLEETNDPNYESFTPREVNSKNKAKIRELQEEQKKIRESLEEEKIFYAECKERLEELTEVIAQAKKDKESSQEDALNNESYRTTLLETQENERQRISRELHDYTVQNLTSLVHKTELCSKLVEMDPIRCKLELNIMTKTLREIIEDTRRMIYNLRPMSFDDIGLDITIERALDKLESSETKKIDFSVEGESYQIKPVIGITILRIIQEGCSNAIKHADSSLIHVLLKYEPDKIVVTIEDDGKGFDVEEVAARYKDDNSGFGLSMMKERVYLLGGNINIESNIDYGTKIIVDVPIRNKEKV